MQCSPRGASAPFRFGLVAGAQGARDQALLERALAEADTAPGDALVAVESVCRRMPTESAPAIVRATLLERFVPGLAVKGWQAAWTREPQRAKLQDAMLRAWLNTHAADKVRELGPAFLPFRCRGGTHEPLLALLREAGLREAGACWREGDVIAGMCFDLSGGRSHMDLLVASGASESRHQVKVGEPFRLPVDDEAQTLSVSFAQRGGQLLQGSPVVFGGAARAASATTVFDDSHVDGVDVIVPVYRDFPGVRRCIESVLASLPLNRAPVRVLVVNDASPDHLLSVWLERLAVTGRITLLRNRFNLGFIEAANRGLRECVQSHALLLNADTEVSGDWVDRLLASLRQSPDVGSVMPWSNNGEMGSLDPAAQADEPPGTQALAVIDTAVADLNRRGELQDVELPACCGFAMLMRRSALDHVGLLDGASLTRGYLEEADWCMRARAAGFRVMLAAGVFISHRGGASFGVEKTLRVAQNRATLAARYPDYYPEYAGFVGRDPLRGMRQTVLARLAEAGANWPHPSSAARGAHGATAWPALCTASVRICIWAPRLSTKGAAKVLALARAVSDLRFPTVRLLVIGGVAEAVWHTGVVDALPPAGVTDLLGDHALLSLGNAVLVLTETEKCPPVGITSASLHEFELNTWLNQQQFIVPRTGPGRLRSAPRARAM